MIPSILAKISRLKSWLSGQKLEARIQVDGGIKYENMQDFINSGADILVMGSAIFKSPDPLSEMAKIKKRLETAKDSA